MKIYLHQLFPAHVSDETAFHLVKFVKDLGLALESVFFEQMLHHSSKHGDYCPMWNEVDDSDSPF